MDPLTGATVFATAVSLISQFRAEQGITKKVETEEFMSWLAENRHESIKELLESNTNTTISVKALLSVNHEELIQRLESLDNALAIYASGVPELSDLANGLRPNNILSEQAISIVKQLDESGGSKILEAQKRGCIFLLITNGSKGSKGQIDIVDQRFIEDDLNTLVEYGLFRHDCNSMGDNLYLLTRSASRYVASLNS